jgi:hypothetical protein
LQSSTNRAATTLQAITDHRLASEVRQSNSQVRETAPAIAVNQAAALPTGTSPAQLDGLQNEGNMVRKQKG